MSLHCDAPSATARPASATSPIRPARLLLRRARRTRRGTGRCGRASRRHRAAAGYANPLGARGRPFGHRQRACHAIAPSPLHHDRRAGRHRQDDRGGGRGRRPSRLIQGRRPLRRSGTAVRSAAGAERARGVARRRHPLRQAAAEPHRLPAEQAPSRRPRQLRARHRRCGDAGRRNILSAHRERTSWRPAAKPCEPRASTCTACRR